VCRLIAGAEDNKACIEKVLVSDEGEFWVPVNFFMSFIAR